MRTKVKEYRHNLNLTQKQLAELCDVSSRAIISIEKGESNPCLILAYKMSKVFGVSIEDLCCLEENLALEDPETGAIGEE